MADKEEKSTGKPNKLFLTLSETNTIWLFSLDTSFSQNDVEDAKKVQKENETYQMKKTKIELIRKRCMADTQTPKHMEKSNGTMTAEIKMKNAFVFASEWDLYDTYNSLDKCEVAASGKYFRFVEPTKSGRIVSSSSSSSVVPTSKPPPENRCTDIFGSPNFKYASLVTERLLASNCFQTEQSVFRKKFKWRYDDEPTAFSYDMEPLWNFQADLQHPLRVTDMDWNPLNQDLLAVGYGGLDFQEKSTGLVCVWSPKNPRQPERRFLLEDSVTSLHYSQTRPNVLAVGTLSGKVYVLDVSTQTGNIRVLGSDGSKPHPGPIWKVEWFLHKELIFESEELLAVGESGVLMRFSTSASGHSTDVLKLNYVSSMKKTPEEKIRRKSGRGPHRQDLIYEKKTFSGLSFSLFSDRRFCYISTKEGVIVKCNLRNPSMLDGIFLGHNGPVYSIEHSPATDLVFLTCGADWNIRIWMEGISQPLITLQNKAPVTCARWSPTIPTLIASIGETELSLWDIARNVLLPKSVRKFEESAEPFSTILFSTNGTNIVVGGQDGLVRVVHLSQLPRIPFLQKEALIAAIRRGLFRNQKLIEEFKRVIERNREKLKTEIIV